MQPGDNALIDQHIMQQGGQYGVAGEMPGSAGQQPGLWEQMQSAAMGLPQFMSDTEAGRAIGHGAAPVDNAMPSQYSNEREAALAGGMRGYLGGAAGPAVGAGLHNATTPAWMTGAKVKAPGLDPISLALGVPMGALAATGYAADHRNNQNSYNNEFGHMGGMPELYPHDKAELGNALLGGGG